MNETTFAPGDDYISLPYTVEKSAEFLKSVEMIDEMPENITSIVDNTYIKGAR